MDTRLKSNYKKLKRTILIRTGLVAFLTLVIGEGIVHFFIDGIFQDLFTNLIMGIFTSTNMDAVTANEWYGRIFMDHKDFFLILGFIILFLIFYNLLIKRMLHYLSSVEAAIDAIQREDDEQIVLVPELRPLEDKLMALRATLKRKEMETAISEQKKNDLVVYLAHDLKTPLTSVVAYLTMLINEFFEITKYNLQDIVLEKEQLNLSMMLEQLADESYGVLRAKYLTCSVETDDDLMVLGDPDKLARVFDNLLRNAIAYSYTDTEIQIEARAKGQDIVITFKNQGHEIPEQSLKTIFEKFYRVDNARSSQTGGSGLGLSIAKRIVELHGGIIEAASDWECTTFTVMLPGISNPTQKVQAPEPPKEEDPMTRHQRFGTNKKSESGKKNRRKV